MPANWLAKLCRICSTLCGTAPALPDAALGYQPVMTPEQQQHWSMLLDRLRVIDPQGARILSLRFEEGLSWEQTAERLRLPGATVRVKEQTAIAWLRRQRLPSKKG